MQMFKFEYKVLELPNLGDQEEFLNKLGSDGWDFISTRAGGNVVWGYFKRVTPTMVPGNFPPPPQTKEVRLVDPRKE